MLKHLSQEKLDGMNQQSVQRFRRKSCQARAVQGATNTPLGLRSRPLTGSQAPRLLRSLFSTQQAGSSPGLTLHLTWTLHRGLLGPTSPTPWLSLHLLTQPELLVTGSSTNKLFLHGPCCSSLSLEGFSDSYWWLTPAWPAGVCSTVTSQRG